MKKTVKAAVLTAGVAVALTAGVFTNKLVADDDHGFGGFHFAPDSLVVTRSVYTGHAGTVTPGEVLPPNCPGGANGTFSVSVPTTTGPAQTVSVTCGSASENGEYPNDRDAHNVWNNAATDPNFGVTSPILLDNTTTDGWLLGTLAVPTNLLVTSFSSKSELAVNRSADGKSVTFMAYRGGPGFPTGTNLLDISNSNTPGVVDPTNAVTSQYYRAVAEVDANGRISVTETNAYSGDNSRAAIKGGNGLYYAVGNDNDGNLSKTQLPITQPGIALVNATGAELITPGQTPPTPPNVPMIGRLQIGKDKPGKDTNFRGVTIFDNTLFISKGSGSNGINTVYQVGTAGTLPTGNATDLATVPITPVPGFPNTTASTNTAFPFGIFVANASTMYVCDEGDGVLVTPAVNGNVADAQSLATAGVQKWVLQNDGTWKMVYVLQNGLNLGVPYSVEHYPASLNPATGGCRNLTGRVNRDGSVTIWAVTSTISANGDQGADPNKLVKVTDVLSATSLPTGDGDRDDQVGIFRVIRSARAGEVLRGVALAPTAFGFDDHDRHF